MSTQQDRPQAQTFEKHAEIAATDADRQIAVGVAMVPDSIDKQNDFERAETIQRLSEGYMERLAAGEAQSGVMHASFPDTDAISHIENRTLDSPETIGSDEYPAGTWVIGKRVKDPDLWQLVENGTLSGFSIGGHIHKAKTYSADELPDDVSVPDGVEAADSEFREIIEASIHEQSFVDHPAVPSAQIQTAKGDGFAKADPRLTAGAETATEFLVNERGHDRDAAEDLARYLNRTDKSATASGGSGTWLSRAKSFFSRRDGGSGAEKTTPDDHDMTDDETEKQGRVLSGDNVKKAMALHDIAIDLLDGTDVRQNRLRFTDDVSTNFDVAEYAQESKAQKAAEPAESGRDADADAVLESMTDDEEMDKFAELVAEKLHDGDNDDEQTDEKADDSEGEMTAAEKLSTLSKNQESLEEAIEQLAESQQQILERIENAEGASQQKASGDGETPDDEMDALKAALG